MGRLGALAAAALLLWLALPAPAPAQAPVANFEYSPPAPLTQEPVTFGSSSSGDILLHRWDLDDDGAFDDGTGMTVSRTFPSSGRFRVRLQVIGEGGSEAVQAQEVVVANRPPSASFEYSPARPLSGVPVSFVSTAGDPEGLAVKESWDLDGDGAFDDAQGGAGSRTFPAPGAYTVALRVVDAEGGVTTTAKTVSVAEPPPTLLSPFPVVRLMGSSTGRGTRVRRLDVEAPRGATIAVRCRGRGCPPRGRGIRARVPAQPTSDPTGRLSFRRLRRQLRPGTVLQVRVRSGRQIGKYTRFRIRRNRAPARRDLCLQPGRERPIRCMG